MPEESRRVWRLETSGRHRQCECDPDASSRRAVGARTSVVRRAAGLQPHRIIDDQDAIQRVSGLAGTAPVACASLDDRRLTAPVDEHAIKRLTSPRRSFLIGVSPINSRTIEMLLCSCRRAASAAKPFCSTVRGRTFFRFIRPSARNSADETGLSALTGWNPGVGDIMGFRPFAVLRQKKRLCCDVWSAAAG